VFKWTDYPELDKALLEWSEHKYTQEVMAKRLATDFPELFPIPPTRNQVKNALATAKEKVRNLSHSPIADIAPYYHKYEAQIKGVVHVEKDYSLLESILEKPKRKVLVLSDIHVPFTDEQKLQKAIDLNRTADLVVLAGDTMDGYGCSRHRKRMNIPHEVEIDNTVRLVEYLSSIFPWVKILKGNHDARYMKKIQDSLPADLLYLFDEEPLDLIVKPFANVEYINEWWVQIGDAIIAHAERSSSYEGRPAVLLSEFFTVKGWAKRLNLTELRVFVQAHTHQVSSVYREGLKMMECGCLTQPQEYTFD
jgi:predicted MPP superfamily phosphohydrolase